MSAPARHRIQGLKPLKKIGEGLEVDSLQRNQLYGPWSQTSCLQHCRQQLPIVKDLVCDTLLGKRQEMCAKSLRKTL